MKKEYNVIKNKGGNYAALEESRKEVLEQIPQKPNTDEALAFYQVCFLFIPPKLTPLIHSCLLTFQSTYGYTEDLRVVIQDLRLRIKACISKSLDGQRSELV